jgi:hypothetical protein
MADIDEEPLFSLTEADIAVLGADKTLITFALTTHVSDEVRKECEAEMEEGKKFLWNEKKIEAAHVERICKKLKI